MSFYVIPSFINLVIKLWLFWHGKNSFLTRNRILAVLLAAFFLVNLAELVSFSVMEFASYHEAAGRAYYIAVIFGAAAMLVYADHITYKKIHWTIPVFLAFNLSLAIMLTDYVIAGVGSLGFILTAVRGDYYWLVQVYLVTTAIAAVGMLLLAKLRHQDAQTRRLSNVIFYSFVPIAMTGIFVVIMMSLGIKINAAVYLTSAITVFLVIVIMAELNHRMLNLLAIAPRFSTGLTTLVCRGMLRVYREGTLDLKSFIKQVEDLVVVNAFEVCGGRRQDAAELLGIPLSTYNEKLRKINVPGIVHPARAA